MSQPSPLVKIRLENALILTGCSIGLSIIVSSLSNSSQLSSQITPQVAFLTIAYHIVVLILPRLNRFRRDSAVPEAQPYPPPYPHVILRPAIGLAGFLCVTWLATLGLSIAGLILHQGPWWGDSLVLAWVQLISIVLETGVMVAIVVQSAFARSIIESEREGSIQI